MKLVILALLLPLFSQAGYDKKQEGFYGKRFAEVSPLRGCEDLHENLFRSGEPDLKSNRWLNKLESEKIDYVVNLRKESLINEEALVLKNGMGYIHLPLTTEGKTQDKIVNLRITHPGKKTISEKVEVVDATIEVLNLIQELTQSGHRVLIHCLHGADRTGTIIGLLRKCPNWKQEYKEFGGGQYAPLDWLLEKVEARSSEY